MVTQKKTNQVIRIESNIIFWNLNLIVKNQKLNTKHQKIFYVDKIH